jgi:hypothetical protein
MSHTMEHCDMSRPFLASSNLRGFNTRRKGAQCLTLLDNCEMAFRASSAVENSTIAQPFDAPRSFWIRRHTPTTMSFFNTPELQPTEVEHGWACRSSVCLSLPSPLRRKLITAKQHMPLGHVTRRLVTSHAAESCHMPLSHITCR